MNRIENYITDTFQGTSHIENQDGFLIIDEVDYTLLFVLDGVSRSLHPKEGVELAIQFINNKYKEYFRINTYYLNDLMYKANECIVKSNLENALTTYCVACILKSNRSRMILSNLGDSRIYLVEQDKIQSVTEDDTLFPGSNVLTKCLGMKNLSKDDFRMGEVELKNRNILLCSDGFYSLLEANKKEFINIFNNQKTSTIKSLLKEKIKGNNFDDSTYIFASNIED